MVQSDCSSAQRKVTSVNNSTLYLVLAAAADDMDPLSGTISMQESRAMKAARSKNRTQDKKSGKMINQTCDTRDFFSSINASPTTHVAPQGQISSDGRVHSTSRKLSMTLTEFDRRMQERRDRARRTAVSSSKSLMYTTRDKQRTYQNMYSILPAIDYDSDMATYRKKQSMKDAWNRANSQDIKYRQSYHKSVAGERFGRLK